MKKVVHKYLIGGVTSSKIQMPTDAIILSVQVQINVGLVLWALHDLSSIREERTFLMYDTGEVIENYDSSKYIYIGTVQYNTDYVTHVFEVVK